MKKFISTVLACFAFLLVTSTVNATENTYVYYDEESGVEYEAEIEDSIEMENEQLEEFELAAEGTTGFSVDSNQAFKPYSCAAEFEKHEIKKVGPNVINIFPWVGINCQVTRIVQVLKVYQHNGSRFVEKFKSTQERKRNPAGPAHWVASARSLSIDNNPRRVIKVYSATHIWFNGVRYPAIRKVTRHRPQSF